MFAFADFVKATTTTTGTGDITLGSSPTGFRSFSEGFTDGAVTDVLVVDNPSAPTQWEVFEATYNDLATDTLTRGDLRSSSTGSRITFSSGTKTVVPAPSALFFNIIAQSINADIDATGSSGAYAVTTAAGLAPTRGYRITFKANHDNPSGGTTINPDTLGGDAIKLADGTDPYAGAIQQDGLYTVEYDGTNFQLKNPTTEIIGQSEAEAGTATTPRLWTSERVRQAVGVAFRSGTASVTGTDIDIPVSAGAEKVEIVYTGLSTNGTSAVRLQLGDAGGIETSGYFGSATNLENGNIRMAQDSSSILLEVGTDTTAADARHGSITLRRRSSNAWVVEGQQSKTNDATMQFSSGSKGLSDELTTIRITANGDTFDGGSMGYSEYIG